MPMSVLQYLKQELGSSASDFMNEWKRLSDEDKSDLKEWAAQEMDILGVAKK